MHHVCSYFCLFRNFYNRFFVLFFHKYTSFIFMGSLLSFSSDHLLTFQILPYSTKICQRRKQVSSIYRTFISFLKNQQFHHNSLDIFVLIQHFQFDEKFRQSLSSVTLHFRYHHDNSQSCHKQK